MVDADSGSPVFADAPDATRIVFVYDSTSAMMQKAADATNELNRRLHTLRPDQSFGIILYKDGGKVLAMSNSLMTASPANKRIAYRFLDDMTLVGNADARPALRLAFEMKPDLIHFFAASDYNCSVPYSRVAEELEKLNATKKVRINTILFEVEKDRLQTKAAMRKIATENVGTFRDWHESDQLNDDPPPRPTTRGAPSTRGGA